MNKEVQSFNILSSGNLLHFGSKSSENSDFGEIISVSYSDKLGEILRFLCKNVQRIFCPKLPDFGSKLLIKTSFNRNAKNYA